MQITELFPIQTLYIGDDWKWSIKLDQYPSASGWVLSYALKRPESATIIITSQQDTDGISHIFNISSTTNAGYLPGVYRAFVYLTSPDSERTTLGSLEVQMVANLATADPSFDTRSHTQKLYDAICLVLEGAVTREYLETTFMDSTFKYKDTASLLRLKHMLKTEIDLENGIKPGRIIRK